MSFRDLIEKINGIDATLILKLYNIIQYDVFDIYFVIKGIKKGGVYDIKETSKIIEILNDNKVYYKKKDSLYVSKYMDNIELIYDGELDRKTVGEFIGYPNSSNFFYNFNKFISIKLIYHDIKFLIYVYATNSLGSIKETEKLAEKMKHEFYKNLNKSDNVLFKVDIESKKEIFKKYYK